MEGKFQLDFYCATNRRRRSQVEDALDYLLHQIGGIADAAPAR